VTFWRGKLKKLDFIDESYHRMKIKHSLKLPKGGNQKPLIQEKKTMQWPIEKGSKWQTIVIIKMHSKLKIEKHESHKN
jgi:hypothetical protein